MKNILYLLALITLISCDKDDNAIPQKHGSVFVTVKYLNVIVADAVVVTEPVTKTVLTDNTGTAFLTDIPVGGYKIVAAHSGIGTGAAAVTVHADTASNVTVQLIGGAFIAPSVDILSPLNASIHALGSPVMFSAVVTDSEDDPEGLEISWSSNLGGELSTTPANTSGNVAFETHTLQAGVHTIILTVTDSDENTSRDSVQITIKNLPGAVTLESIESTSTGLMLEWSASQEAAFSQYAILRSEDPLGPFEVTEVISDIGNTGHLDENVMFGKRYYYQIRVDVQDGDQSFSNMESAVFEGEHINIGVKVERMMIDETRPFLYALDRINNTLIFVNTTERTVEKTIFVGSSPTDMDINTDNTRLYVANYGSNQIAVINLDTQEKIDDLTVDTEAGTWSGNPYRIVCMGNDKLAYTSEDQHNNIKLVNAQTGELIFVTTGASVYESGLLTSPNESILYATESGSTGSSVVRFDLVNDMLVRKEASERSTNFGTRDACISADGIYIFYNRFKLLTGNLLTNLGSFSEYIHACNADGSIAIGSSNIWDANNFSIIQPLPLTSEIMVLGTNDHTLYIYDETSSKIYILSI